MAKITRLQYQRIQQRVNIYLDGTFGFGLSTEIALKNHLKVGKELVNEEISKLLFESLEFELTEQSVQLIAIRPRSLHEVKQYLQKRLHVFQQKQKKGITRPIIDEIMSKKGTLIKQITEKMVTNGIINDDEFAKWWIATRLTSKPRGKIALMAELMNKGVPKDVITTVLSNSSLLSEESNEAMIDKLLAKAWRSLKNRNYDKRKMRMMLSQRLLAKGFSWEEVRSKIDELLSSEYN